MMDGVKIAKNRRSYSQEILEKAIADIQSGRIGTRKASSLYGIPRSTLRNKVVRIKNQLKSNQELHHQQEQQRLMIQTGSNTSAVNDNQEDESEGDDDTILFKENLFGELIYLDVLNNLTPTSCCFDDTAAIECLNFFRKSSKVLLALKLIRKRLARRLINSRTKYMAKLLKSLAKKKSNQSLLLPDGSSAVTPSSQLLIESANACSSYSKPLRAKRGQYRKYESTQLNNAVEAVIHGSMSVHRAGSVFGVPHSTLEYKVKEKLAKRF